MQAPLGVMSVLKNQVFTKDQRQKRNYLLHLLYVRKDFDECMRLADDTLEQCGQLAEYPLYVKALILRHRGQIPQSLKLFQAATVLNPTNVNNLKQVGKSLFLLGKHKGALEVYEEAVRLGHNEDWEIWHNRGLCLAYLKRMEEAQEAFMRANSVQRHDCTFLQLGQIFTQQDDYKSAIDVYLEALEFSPENPELLTTIGLLYLRLSENFRAFDFLGNSLTHDPRNPKTILAAGSIIQDHSDVDVALIKYRVAAVQTPNSAQLWNNIGMCFFGKQRFVAAIACLKKALYHDPFEWIISYNLGLVHLNTQQYASAFHYFSSSINLKPDFASSYMHLGITLARLSDIDNSCSAYEKAIEMDDDFLFHLNYAIMLTNNDQIPKAKKHLAEFERLFEQLDAEAKTADADVTEMRAALKAALNA
mmetsp:Transcript_7584/g.14903  ORF Transcript_7584/g.14903 Transcript_7584/m.14903 type:complete len:419 (+) Transcript_7584:263-1519(+)|eukprot:CAMPEP_0173383154 /NCGR_PEP_ID=MMETSP1356-20130122/5681_1 /TAXON_ID=77927 ORGANISM="Hemiselmis virescens, Strain PCC157" /NCGR_SAMPLE_ID=MMETSP1356 /ASSEMBLY_ACC=CAM_ASM_000847 /LENGTH=418 /DNA_ID=CAMNT_0014337851 /DNA_START=161 /DNA_END=1417 /DNA_ORIENTATION=+